MFHVEDYDGLGIAYNLVSYN